MRETRHGPGPLMLLAVGPLAGARAMGAAPGAMPGLVGVLRPPPVVPVSTLSDELVELGGRCCPRE